MMMAEKEGLRERGGEGEKGGDSSVWPREGWGIPACLLASRWQRADAASSTDFRHHSVGALRAIRRSCLLAAAVRATRGRESMTCKALREKALGRGKNQEKSLRGFESNSKWRSMRT